MFKNIFKKNSEKEWVDTDIINKLGKEVKELEKDSQKYAGMATTGSSTYTSKTVTVTKPLHQVTGVLTGLSSGLHPGQNQYIRSGSASSGSYSPQFTVGSGSNNTVITFLNPNGNEIVRLERDGTVIWGNGIKVDSAAEAFSKSISLGAEIKSGITQCVKQKMRDSVFDDLINIAKEKGSLTAEDLTYLLEASKIVEKLKGSNERN
jgi:ribosomal protein S11